MKLQWESLTDCHSRYHPQGSSSKNKSSFVLGSTAFSHINPLTRSVTGVPGCGSAMPPVPQAQSPVSVLPQPKLCSPAVTQHHHTSLVSQEIRFKTHYLKHFTPYICSVQLPGLCLSLYGLCQTPAHSSVSWVSDEQRGQPVIALSTTQLPPEVRAMAVAWQ